ncbi:unnamed protein product [marine sediment metagenome]|uniref:Glycosyl transferase family 1 domain-containing protein n=1 Tax=marine sediment metagenome TaxID=412755 RepID=X0SWG6_9ZZZZ
MKKPKILFLNPAVSPYRIGFYDKLSKICNVKYLFYFKDCKIYNEMRNWNYEILSGEYKVPGYGRGFTPSLAKRLYNEDYDIVVNSDPCSFAAHIAFPIARHRKKKFVTWSELWKYPNHWTAQLIKPYVKMIIYESDICIAAGTKAKELLERFGAKKIAIAPTASFDVMKQKNYQVKLPKKYILSVGSIRPADGVLNLISAFYEVRKKHKALHLVLVGKPTDKAYYKECRKKADASVHFIGQVDWDKLRPYYENCLCCVSSGQPVEGIDPYASWEMSLNEAMSASKPVISTDIVGGAFDLIHHGKNGYIVSTEETANLTDAINKVLKFKGLCPYSRKLIDKTFNHKNMARKFKEALDEI